MSRRTPMSEHRSRILLILIFLLALALRGYRLDGQSLWADEGNSAALASRPLAQIAHDSAHDIHPPLYYWLLHGWTRLAGTSEIALRSLSALLGLLLVWLIYLIGRRLHGQAGRWGWRWRWPAGFLFRRRAQRNVQVVDPQNLS